MKEYFEDLFKRRKLDLYDFNSYEFCEKDNEDYLARQGVREKDPVLSKEKERLRTNSFLRGENSSLSILSKSHVDHDKKPKSVRL